jgi:hypothetical protein
VFGGYAGEETGELLQAPKLCFVESDGQGHIAEHWRSFFDSAKTVEGQRPALPAPQD